MLRHSMFRLVLAMLLLVASAAGAQQLAYEMTLIPRLDYPNGLNDLGQIAANGFNANGDIQAAVWTPRATPALRFLGTSFDASIDINNAGQVTGMHHNEGRQIASLACRIDNASACMPALLSPVPEPAAPALWSGGLLLLASRWVLRRSSRHHAGSKR